MHRRKRLTQLNPHLCCTLCNGYFIDATTIVECLHSFCRSCLLRHLEASKTCPICSTNIHEAKPHLSIKPDKTLQDIVYKLVPGLYHAEMKRRRDYYDNHPHYDPGSNNPEDRGVPINRIIYSPDDTISLSLEYLPMDRDKEESDSGSTQSSESDQNIENPPPKRFLQCPAQVEMSHLKKFIKLKYDLEDIHKVELFYRKESLPDEYTLMDVAYIYTWKRSAPMKFFYRISDQSLFTSQPPTIQETTTATTTTNSNNKVKEEIQTAIDPPVLPIENPTPAPQPVAAPLATPAPEVPETKPSVSPPPPQVTKHKTPPPLIKDNPPPTNTPQPTPPSPTPQVSKSQSLLVKSPLIKNMLSSKIQGKTSQTTKSSNTPKNAGKAQQSPNSRQVGTGAKNSNPNLTKTPNNSTKSQMALPKSNQTKANSTSIAPRPLQPLAPKTTAFTSKTLPIAPKGPLPQIAKSSTPMHKVPSPSSVKFSVASKPPQSPSNVSQTTPKCPTNSVKTVANANKNVSVTSGPKTPVTPGPKVNNNITARAKSPIPNKTPKTPCPPISMSSPSTQNKTNVNITQGTSKDQLNSVNNDKKETVQNAITTKTSSSSTNSTTTPVVASTASPLTTSSTTTPMTTSTPTTASSSALATAASITQLLGNRGVFASPSVSPSSPSPASPRTGSGLTITPIAAPKQQPKPPPPQLQPLRSISTKPSSLTIEARPRSDTPKPQNTLIYQQNVFANKPKTQSNGQDNNTSTGSGTSTPTPQQRHLSSNLFAAAMAGQRPDAKSSGSSSALRLARRPGQTFKAPAPPGVTSLSTPPSTASTSNSSSSPGTSPLSLGSNSTQSSSSTNSRPITPKSMHQQIMRSNDEITAPEPKRMKFTTVPQMRRVSSDMGSSMQNNSSSFNTSSFPVGKPNQQILRSNDQIVVPPSNAQNRPRQQLLKSNDELLPSYMRRQQANIQSTLRRSEHGSTNNNSTTNNTNNNHQPSGAAKRKRPRIDHDQSQGHSMMPPPPKAGPSNKTMTTNSAGTSPNPSPVKDSRSGVREHDFHPLDLSGTKQNLIMSIDQNLIKRRQQSAMQQQNKGNSPNNVLSQPQSPSQQSSSQQPPVSQRTGASMLNSGWVPPGARTPRPSPPDHPWLPQRPATANGLPN